MSASELQRPSAQRDAARLVGEGTDVGHHFVQIPSPFKVWWQ